MSKIPKLSEEKQMKSEKSRSDETFAYRSITISVVLGSICFIVSILFNLEIITILMNIDLVWTIIDVVIKVIVVLLFFLFIITGYANYKELVGKRLNWKELLMFILLSIGQTLLNLSVFTLTLIGIFIIVIYLFLIQE